MSSHHQQHFLIAALPTQSHINPALHLAHRLISTGALVTFSTSASAHRRMFSSSTSGSQGGNLLFIPYPDGYVTRTFQPDADTTSVLDSESYYSDFSTIILDLAARGRRVTCVIYTLLLTWAADVAHELGIPSAQFWIQPATAFAAYYHYFHGYESLVSAHSKEPRFPIKFPGLPSMEIRDIPSFLTSDTSNFPETMIRLTFRKSFEAMDKAEPPIKILVNTCDKLEPEALSAVETLDLIPIGPILPAATGLDLFESDDKRYMEWLNTRADKSVVYVSFGSVSVLQKKHIEEISKGLKASGRPYLWVVRKDSRCEGVELEREDDDSGIVVEWCSQVQVLSHPAVGCFVTHCGWNSTTESLVCGVPTVAVPLWADQGTNAMLMDKAWRMGVRAEANEDGILEGEELKRCLDLVMGEDEKGREIRKNAEFWRGKCRDAVGEGGSSERNLMAFVDDIAKHTQSF